MTKTRDDGPDPGAQPVRIVRRPEDVRLAAVIHTRNEEVRAALMALSRPADCVVANDCHEIHDAMNDVTAPTLLAMGLDAGDPIRTTRKVLQWWPTARCVWFEPFATADVPSQPLLLREVAGLPLERMGTVATAKAILRAAEAGLLERRMQIEAAREFARNYGLSPLMETVTVLIALRVRPERVRQLIGQTGPRFNKFCSKELCPRLFVSSFASVITKVLDFQCKWIASHKEY
jgi:hypothetical protein